MLQIRYLKKNKVESGHARPRQTQYHPYSLNKFIYTHMYTNTYLYTHAYKYMHTHMYVYTHIYVHIDKTAYERSKQERLGTQLKP